MCGRDISRCSSKDCPRYDQCERSVMPVGVYTVSNFREVCNQNNRYQLFIEKVDERVRFKSDCPYQE